MSKSKAGKRKAKKLRQKLRKKKLKEQDAKVKALLAKNKVKSELENDEKPKIEVVPEPLVDEMQVLMENVFNKFKEKKDIPQAPASGSAFEDVVEKIRTKTDQDAAKAQLATQPEEDKPLSNKKKKELRRLKISELKMLVERPDTVEEHDCNASDPKLLVELKCLRNTIPVPEHWGRKRKYLQGKRGFEKPPFELPAYIKATGITAIRDEQLRIYSEKTRKQKQRSAKSGAKGKMAINYQTLYDAFFIHRTKPPLTAFGDCYFEQKEMEMKYRKFHPGKLSDRLKKALGMPATWRVISPGGIPVYDDLEDDKPREGQILAAGTELTWDETSDCGRWIKIVRPVNGWIHCKGDDGKIHARQIQYNCPTPWLIAQQRFGPAPAYPDLKIPGLNSPIPPGHEYGYGEGQWGKPPVGRDGQPLYGNPFGPFYEIDASSLQPKPHWGDLEEVSDDESSDEEESSEEEEEEIPEGAMSGTSMTSGITSGMGTGTISTSSQSQNEFNLRKKAGVDTPESQKQLYTVMQQKEHSVAGQMFGSSHVYELSKMESGKDEVSSNQRVDVTLNPEELVALDEQKLKRKFEDALQDSEENPRRRKSRFGDRRNKEYDVKF